MEEKKSIKINVVTVLLIISLIVIGIVSFFACKFYNDKNIETNKVENLNNKVSNLENSLKNNQNKENTTSNVTNSTDKAFEDTYNLKGEFSGKMGTLKILGVNENQLSFSFDAAAGPDGYNETIEGIANVIPDGDNEANERYEYDGSELIKQKDNNVPKKHYRYITQIGNLDYKMILYFVSADKITCIEKNNGDLISQMNLWRNEDTTEVEIDNAQPDYEITSINISIENTESMEGLEYKESKKVTSEGDIEAILYSISTATEYENEDIMDFGDCPPYAEICYSTGEKEYVCALDNYDDNGENINLIMKTYNEDGSDKVLYKVEDGLAERIKYLYEKVY